MKPVPKKTLLQIAKENNKIHKNYDASEEETELIQEYFKGNLSAKSIGIALGIKNNGNIGYWLLSRLRSAVIAGKIELITK